ncbi:hypothetical protein HEK616_84620 (plasmid) [Streptomyces nigrescens]|uniref:Transposase n=1 Tax=Streptomyces nigrescens TaxID=1920 RepID=A0ABM8A8W6_STRNI|nr:hypothetical protein HEK616_84620 [Streptomyces nigrescens]
MPGWQPGDDLMRLYLRRVKYIDNRPTPPASGCRPVTAYEFRFTQRCQLLVVVLLRQNQSE